MPDLVRLESATYQENVRQDSELSPVGLPQWFALAVKPGCDQAVADALATKRFETLFPTYKKMGQCKSRTTTAESPLFPGYIFCRFNVLARLPILMTPGVTHVLGRGSVPMALSDTEIRSLQTAVAAKVALQPFPYIQVGQKVRIEEGVLAGVEGVIIQVKESLRLILSITLLRRSVLLEVDEEQVRTQRVIRPVAGSTFA